MGKKGKKNSRKPPKSSSSSNSEETLGGRGKTHVWWKEKDVNNIKNDVEIDYNPLYVCSKILQLKCKIWFDSNQGIE